MPGEHAAQQQHVREMDKVLLARKGLWRNDRNIMVKAYIQHCILPRVTYSPADAAFCAVFTQRLIDFQMPWFPAFIYLDAVSSLSSSVSGIALSFWRSMSRNNRLSSFPCTLWLMRAADLASVTLLCLISPVHQQSEGG